MKTIYTIIAILSLLFIGSLNAQHLLTEDFEYTAGTFLNTHSNWWPHSGWGTNVLTITTPGLSYPGYPGSDIGNAVTMNVNGEDCGDTIGVKITSGNVYLSAMVNVSAAQTGDYFLHLGTGTSSFYARLYVKASGGGFNFGIARSATSSAAYLSTVYNLNQTYLIVIKYTFVEGMLNDSAVLFINPIPGSAEPSPDLVATDITGGDAITIDKIFLRQGSSGSSPKVIVDGIRVSTTWDDLPLPVELSSFTSKLNGRDVNLIWSTQTEKNSNKFLIERKSTLENWESLGSLKAAVLSNSLKLYSYLDKNLNSGKYQYRLKMIDNDGTFEYSKTIEVIIESPNNFELSQNYPNPFNPSTVISYSLPSSANIKLIVYNTLGQSIKTLESGYKPAGNYSINFNASDLPSGIYFYKLEAGSFTQIKKMILLK
jgi:hypothetical protein